MAAAWFANTGAQNDCPPRPLPNNPWHPKRPKGHALLHGIFAVRCPEVRKRWFGGPAKRQHAKHTGQSAFQRSMGFGAAKTHGTLEGGNPPPTDFFFRGAPSVGRPPWAHRGAQAKGMQGKNPRGAQAARPHAPNTRRDCGFAGVHLASRRKAHGNLLSGAGTTRPERRKTQTMRKVAPPQRPLSNRGCFTEAAPHLARRRDFTKKKGGQKTRRAPF